MQIHVKYQTKAPIVDEYKLSAVVDQFCNHAGAEFVEKEMGYLETGPNGIEEKSRKEYFFECQCGAWCYADQYGMWHDEYMKLERVNRKVSKQLVLQ